MANNGEAPLYVRNMFGYNGHKRVYKGNTVGSRNVQLDSEQRAYLAGFLDGDGCIASHYEKDRRDSSERVRIRVSFTQSRSRRIVLDTLRRWIGSGTVAEYDHNNMAEYIVHDQNVIRQLLPMIIPFLIVKNEHAELALRILQIKESGYNPTSLFQMRDLTCQIRALNNYPKRTLLTP